MWGRPKCFLDVLYPHAHLNMPSQHTHTHTHTHTRTLSLSVSLSHTHTHTYIHTFLLSLTVVPMLLHSASAMMDHCSLQCLSFLFAQSIIQSLMESIPSSAPSLPLSLPPSLSPLPFSPSLTSCILHELPLTSGLSELLSLLLMRSQFSMVWHASYEPSLLLFRWC